MSGTAGERLTWLRVPTEKELPEAVLELWAPSLQKLGFVPTGRTEQRACRARGTRVPCATYTLDLADEERVEERSHRPGIGHGRPAPEHDRVRLGRRARLIRVSRGGAVALDRRLTHRRRGPGGLGRLGCVRDRRARGQALIGHRRHLGRVGRIQPSRLLLPGHHCRVVRGDVESRRRTWGEDLLGKDSGASGRFDRT